MANWTKTVDIRPIMRQDDNTDKTATKISKQIADKLAKELPKDQYPCVHKFHVPRFRRARSMKAVNNALQALYDWADTNRIWLGI